MKFFEKIVAGAEYRVASGLMNPAGWLTDAFGATDASSGERVTRGKAMGLAAVFSAVEKISESVGSLPLKVYRVMDDDDRVEARTHRSWRMLHDKPNDETTAHAFWSTVTAQLLLDGNSFIWKERGEFGEVESLYLIDPSSVTIEWDGRKKVFVQQGSEGRRAFTSEEVLHIMGFSLDGIIGCSRITYCREALGTAIGRARFEGEFYAQGAKFPGVIEYPGRLGEQGVKNLAAAMAAKHGGPGQRHKVPVLEEGATFKPVGMSLADMQFVENSQMSRADIATMFNLPASYLNASSGDSLTYATTESNQIQFAQMAIVPITNRIAKALTTDPSLLPWNVMYAEFVLEKLLRADMKTRAEYWASMKTTLGLDPEFIAARENIPQSALKEPEPVPAPLVPLPMSAEVAQQQLLEMRSRGLVAPPHERDVFVVNVPASMDELADGLRDLASAQRQQEPQIITINPPEVTVLPPDVHVAPAEINVHTPDVHVAPAEVTVHQADVHVAPAEVTVHPAAINNYVDVPALPPPASVDAHFHPPRGRVKRTIVRDPATNEITGSIEEPSEE